MKENATMEIVNVPFGNDVIPATIDEDKTVWSVLSQICKNIGLTEKQKDAQVKKVKEDIVLKNGSEKLTLKFEGQVREALCIKNDYLPLWLAKISITPAMQRDNPEATEKLVRYQLEAKDVLAEYFGFKEKEKLSSAQFSSSIPDSVASAMMMMQVNTINAFKESTKSMLDKQNQTLENVLTYCKSVAEQNNTLNEQNRTLSDGLQNSFKIIEEKDDKIKELIDFIMEHKNVKTNEIVENEVDTVKRFILSNSAMKWKTEMQNKWQPYFHLACNNETKSYGVLYNMMLDMGYDVNAYKEKLDSEYKNGKYSISKINTCAYFEELHSPFELAMKNFIDSHCENKEDQIIDIKEKKSKSINARYVPSKFRKKAEELIVCGAESIKNGRVTPYFYRNVYEDFFNTSSVNKENLVNRVCEEQCISYCSPAYAICFYNGIWEKFEKYVDERVIGCL